MTCYGLGMNDTLRPRSDRQIWITRGHLGALAVTTASLALLTFLVGVQVGRRTAPEVATTDISTGLLPDAESQASLELLLREVELAQGSIDPTGQSQVALDFPELLGEEGTKTPDAVAPMTATVSIAPAAGDPPRPPESRPPVDGWSVQIASYPTREEADSHLAVLQEQGLEAYRVAALVDGRTWHRVRIGGFDSRARAEKARASLAERLATPDLVLAAAP